MYRNKLFTLDIGSFNIKVSTGEIFENRFIQDSDSEIFGAETVQYKGKTYFFNKGTFDKTISKTHKNFEIPLLYALGKAGAEGNINIILHLPSSQIAMKNVLVEALKGKTFKFKVNNVEKEVTIDSCGILKEGFSSFYSLAKRNQGLIAIGDIGGRSSDFFFFNNGSLEKEISINIGTMDYFKNIVNSLNNKGQNRKLEDIHKLIANNIIDLEDFTDITNSIAASIINEVKIEVDNLDDYSIKMCGGGSEYFNNIFSRKFKKVELISQNILSNVNGATQIGKAKGLDK